MKRYTVIDAHCDTASELLDRGETLLDNTCHLSLKHMLTYQSYVQFFAAWVSKQETSPYRRALQILSYLKGEIKKYSEKIAEIHTAEELKKVIENHKCGVILSIEDGRAIEGSLEKLHELYNFGVRAMTLAWNDNNEITDGIDSCYGRGLTPFGKTVVSEMNRLGMIVDVSHITEKGFWDVLEVSTRPVMASHSNCRSLCSHRRNLEDEQIKALIASKGFIGINLYREFLTDWGEANLDGVIHHIEHIASLGGEHIMGLGSDFDGMDALPKEISHAGDYDKIFDRMCVLGYTDDFIEKITHKNMIQFIERVEKRNSN